MPRQIPIYSAERLWASDHLNFASPRLQSDHHKAVRELIRPVLVPLLLTTPPSLPVPQRSPDLLMRQRMLGLPIDPPHACDFGHDDDYPHRRTVTEDECIASHRAFASWLSRSPIELGIHTTHLEMTASLLFFKRSQVQQFARHTDRDPIESHGFEALCCDAWHTQRKVLVGLPRPHECDMRLYMTVVFDESEEVQLDNLFVLYKKEEAQIERLHRWTEDCRRSWTRVKMEDEEEGSQGAEYINDADDFWAGYSDDEEVDRKGTARAQGEGQASAAQTGGIVDPSTSATSADQEAAIKDIIRSAYTLHRTTQSASTGEDSVEAFLQFVKAALPGNSASIPFTA